MSKKELLPCPFCGSKARLVRIAAGCAAECTGCGVRMMLGGVGAGWYATDGEAAADWNRRQHSAPAAPEADLSSDERVAALCDLSYRAGLRAGWNYCTDGDQTGFARSLESTREALAVLNEHRQKGAPAAPEQEEHERKLFEARMRRVAPGVNLEMIGDRYNELDTQWKFELWLARAALAGKGGE